MVRRIFILTQLSIMICLDTRIQSAARAPESPTSSLIGYVCALPSAALPVGTGITLRRLIKPQPKKRDRKSKQPGNSLVQGRIALPKQSDAPAVQHENKVIPPQDHIPAQSEEDIWSFLDGYDNDFLSSTPVPMSSDTSAPPISSYEPMGLPKEEDVIEQEPEEEEEEEEESAHEFQEGEQSEPTSHCSPGLKSHKQNTSTQHPLYDQIMKKGNPYHFKNIPDGAEDITCMTLIFSGKLHFACPGCDQLYTATKSSHMKAHIIENHLKLRCFFCPDETCNYHIEGFYRNDALIRHLNTVHKRQSLHSCSICSKTFGRSDHLVSHHKVYKGNCLQAQITQTKRKMQKAAALEKLRTANSNNSTEEEKEEEGPRKRKITPSTATSKLKFVSPKQEEAFEQEGPNSSDTPKAQATPPPSSPLLFSPTTLALFPELFHTQL